MGHFSNEDMPVLMKFRLSIISLMAIWLSMIDQHIYRLYIDMTPFFIIM